MVWMYYLFLGHPYLLIVLAVAGWGLLRLHRPIRRRLKSRGWPRRARRVAAYGTTLLGLALILLASGYLLPIGIMLVTQDEPPPHL